jgi:hypothetical protein
LLRTKKSFIADKVKKQAPPMKREHGTGKQTGFGNVFSGVDKNWECENTVTAIKGV